MWAFYIDFVMFKLKRHFSIASLLGIVAAITILTLLYGSIATDALIEQETRANVALTRAFANAIWPVYGEFVKEQKTTSREQLLAHPTTAQIEQDVRLHMQGLNVAKIKIYNLTGLTVFSTENSQIGQSKSGNLGFAKAKDGQPASELTFRNEFYSFEGEISDRNILASYIPIQKHNNSEVEAVFELYSDVTPLVKKLKNTQWHVAIGVFSTLAVLYLFLYIIVYRADKIIFDSANKIRHQAFFDPFTGLPNRSHFAQTLDESIRGAGAKDQDSVIGILFLGLDHFKVINDSLGHDAGDRTIKLASARIAKAVGDSNRVFRMGGDEFAIVVYSARDNHELAELAQAVLKRFEAPFYVFQRELTVSASIGITVFPKDASVSELLVKFANIALSRAKEEGRNCFRFYTDDMNVRALQRLAFEQDLRLAMARKEFRLHYQPKVCTDSGVILGMEALIRWEHPSKGLLAPGVFLPYLEDAGLMGSVGEWVLRQACADTQQWIKQGHPPIRVSVNIASAQFFSSSFINTIQGALADAGLPPQLLELELTETLLVKNAESACRLLSDIKTLGVMLSIDDFGTGYSSLSYLKDFPLDVLKIDRSFIQDIATNPRIRAISLAICNLGHSLGMRLVAEGVEDDDQFAILKSQRCHEIQGFLFCKPLPLEELKIRFPVVQRSPYQSSHENTMDVEETTE